MKFIPSLVATIGLCGIPVLSSSLSDGSVEVHDMIVKTFQHASTFIDLTLASFAGNELPNLDDRNIVMDAQIYNTTIYDLMGTQKSNKKGTLREGVGLGVLANPITGPILAIPLGMYEGHVQHKAEKKFTRGMTIAAYHKFPCYNHVVWHVTGKEFKDAAVAKQRLVNAKDLTCIWRPFSLNIFSFAAAHQRVQNYFMCSFESGTYFHQGDGSYINWAFEGNSTRMDKHGKPDKAGPIVHFDSIDKRACNFSLAPENATNRTEGNYWVPWNVPVTLPELDDSDNPTLMNAMDLIVR